MGLHVRRFASLMLTSIAFTGPFAHLMELPAKMSYDPALYTRLQQSLYFNYGRISGTAEILAVIATCELAWKLRKSSKNVSRPAAVAAGCMAFTHAIFWSVVSPANAEIATWSVNDAPPDWERWRQRWELGHASRALLELGALVALTQSVLTEIAPPAIKSAS